VSGTNVNRQARRLKSENSGPVVRLREAMIVKHTVAGAHTYLYLYLQVDGLAANQLLLSISLHLTDVEFITSAGRPFHLLTTL